MKKALISATTAYMLHQFCHNNIELLLNMGFQVDVACNLGKENPMSEVALEEFKGFLAKNGVSLYEVDCPNRVKYFKRIITTYRQFKLMAHDRNYDLVHTQTPIGGVLCRLGFRSARKRETTVIYQAHGFHFYDGAPLKNWLIYYPIEKWCSRFTDVLVTINQEDYQRAKQKFHAGRVVYIPGVGVDVEKFSKPKKSSALMRSELGVSEHSLVLLSVGELNDNKNHASVICALEQLQRRNELHDLRYIIVGAGEKQNQLYQLAARKNLLDIVSFLGYRTDMPDLYNMSDAFIFPSFREGLSVSVMEAMASGLPVICGAIRGNVDLIDVNGGMLFNPGDINSICDSIVTFVRLSNEEKKSFGTYNRKKVAGFSKDVVESETRLLYETATTRIHE